MSNFFAKLVCIAVVGAFGVGAAHASAKDDLKAIREEIRQLRAEKAELKAAGDLAKARAQLEKLRGEVKGAERAASSPM